MARTNLSVQTSGEVVEVIVFCPRDQAGKVPPAYKTAIHALAVYFKVRWGAVGGTSAAAPIWAAGLALVNEGMIQQVHKFNYGPQIFYLVSNRANGTQPYFDVTRGNNLYFPAGSGWDFATGLGTPNLPSFYQTMSGI